MAHLLHCVCITVHSSVPLVLSNLSFWATYFSFGIRSDRIWEVSLMNSLWQPASFRLPGPGERREGKCSGVGAEPAGLPVLEVLVMGDGEGAGQRRYF